MNERGRERDRDTHKMRGSRGHVRAVTKVSDGLMVIRFQCPMVAWKEKNFPFSLPLLLLLSWAACPGAGSAREGETEDWGWSSPGDSPLREASL